MPDTPAPLQGNPQPNRLKSPSALTVPEIKIELARNNIPFKHSFRQAELVKLYNTLTRLPSSNTEAEKNQKKQRKKRKVQDQIPSAFSGQQLKDLLKKEGIKFRANASLSSLNDLYQRHISPRDQPSYKRPRCEDHSKESSFHYPFQNSSAESENSGDSAPRQSSTEVGPSLPSPTAPAPTANLVNQQVEELQSTPDYRKEPLLLPQSSGNQFVRELLTGAAPTEATQNGSPSHHDNPVQYSSWVEAGLSSPSLPATSVTEQGMDVPYLEPAAQKQSTSGVDDQFLSTIALAQTSRPENQFFESLAEPAPPKEVISTAKLLHVEVPVPSRFNSVADDSQPCRINDPDQSNPSEPPSAQNDQFQSLEVSIADNESGAQPSPDSKGISPKKVRWSLPENDCKSLSPSTRAPLCVPSQGGPSKKKSKSRETETSQIGPYAFSVERFKRLLAREGVKYQKNATLADLAKLHDKIIKDQRGDVPPPAVGNSRSHREQSTVESTATVTGPEICFSSVVKSLPLSEESGSSSQTAERLEGTLISENPESFVSSLTSSPENQFVRELLTGAAPTEATQNGSPSHHNNPVQYSSWVEAGLSSPSLPATSVTEQGMDVPYLEPAAQKQSTSGVDALTLSVSEQGTDVPDLEQGAQEKSNSGVDTLMLSSLEPQNPKFLGYHPLEGEDSSTSKKFSLENQNQTDMDRSLKKMMIGPKLPDKELLTWVEKKKKIGRKLESEHKRIDTSCLSPWRLKQLLKQAGIKYPTNARPSILAKLCNRALSKKNSKRLSSKKSRLLDPKCFHSSSNLIEDTSLPRSTPLASLDPQLHIQRFAEQNRDSSSLLSVKRDYPEFKWPRPSLLTSAEIKAYLQENNVEYSKDDDILTLAKIYRSMVESIRSCFPSKRRHLNHKPPTKVKSQKKGSKHSAVTKKNRIETNFGAVPKGTLLENSTEEVNLQINEPMPFPLTPLNLQESEKSSVYPEFQLQYKKTLPEDNSSDGESNNSLLSFQFKGKASKSIMRTDLDSEIDTDTEIPKKKFTTQSLIDKNPTLSHEKIEIQRFPPNIGTLQDINSNGGRHSSESRTQQEYESSENSANSNNNIENKLYKFHHSSPKDSNSDVEDSSNYQPSSESEIQLDNDYPEEIEISKATHHSMEELCHNENYRTESEVPQTLGLMLERQISSPLPSSQSSLTIQELHSEPQSNAAHSGPVENVQNEAQVHPEDFPSSARLTVAQMKARLDLHSVSYKSRDRKPRIVELYDAMRARELRKSCQKKRTVDLSSKNSSTSTLLSKMKERDLPHYFAEADRSPSYNCLPASVPATPSSPPLLFSENINNENSYPDDSPMQSIQNQSPVGSSLSAIESITYENINQRAAQMDRDLEDQMMLDNNSSDVFTWRNTVPSGNKNFSAEDCPLSADLLSTVTSYAGTSTKIAGKILEKMTDVADTLEDLSISLYAASSGCMNTSGSSNMVKKLSNTSQFPHCGKFARLICQHIATLLGSRDGSLPLPCNGESPMDIDNDLQDSDADPCYPYPGGPGHPAATPQTLSIMWRMMREAKIHTFRPDFSQPCDSPDNKYLFDLSVKIFLELVRCGEYTGVNEENLNNEIIQNAIYLHVNQRLRRRYRQENQWSEEQKSKQEKKLCCNSRLANLRRSRLATLSRFDDLYGLIPIVERCCSDDETDTECSLSIQQSYSQKQPKICVVRNVLWRHTRITAMMDALDELKALSLESKPKGVPGAASRIRRRVSLPPITQIQPPSKLPKACFDSDWLSSQPQQRIDALELRSNLGIKDLICKLKGSKS